MTKWWRVLFLGHAFERENKGVIVANKPPQFQSSLPPKPTTRAGGIQSLGKLFLSKKSQCCRGADTRSHGGSAGFLSLSLSASSSAGRIQPVSALQPPSCWCWCCCLWSLFWLMGGKKRTDIWAPKNGGPTPTGKIHSERVLDCEMQLLVLLLLLVEARESSAFMPRPQKAQASPSPTVPFLAAGSYRHSNNLWA